MQKLNNLKLFNCDCLDIMEKYADNYFDLAIIDPPYGINESGQTNKSRSKLTKSKDYGNKNWDKKPPSPVFFDLLNKKCKNFIIFGANHFLHNIKIETPTPCWLVWDKKNGNNDFADCELALTSFKTAVRNFSFRWQGMFQGDMKNKENRIHPTQKPVALYDWIYHNYAKKEFKILDTHLGSGSNAISAHYFGVSEFVGIEIDEEYYNAAIKRFNEQTKQIKLFN